MNSAVLALFDEVLKASGELEKSVVNGGIGIRVGVSGLGLSADDEALAGNIQLDVNVKPFLSVGFVREPDHDLAVGDPRSHPFELEQMFLDFRSKGLRRVTVDERNLIRKTGNFGVRSRVGVFQLV